MPPARHTALWQPLVGLGPGKGHAGPTRGLHQMQISQQYSSPRDLAGGVLKMRFTRSIRRTQYADHPHGHKQVLY